MKKWDNKYWNVIVVILFLLVCVYAHLRSGKYVSYVEKHGVWTIYTLGRVSHAPRGGLQAPTYYTFNGREYRDGTGVRDEIGRKGEGRRFFMMLIPEEPTKVLYVSGPVPVPSWFTLEAPAEGWLTKPTENDLREMMVQDSLKRGLKRTLSIDTEIENNEEVGQ